MRRGVCSGFGPSSYVSAIFFPALGTRQIVGP